MSRDHLDADKKAQLKEAPRRTTLPIVLGDGTPLYFSTGDTPVGDILYLGKLEKAADALNLEMTKTVETQNFKISNKTLVLGHLLINTPNVLNKMRAKIGTAFKNKATGVWWHDVKLPGRIETGNIDGDWVNLTFISLTAALKYDGITIESAFPDSVLEVPPAVQPVYNDLLNPGINYGNGGYSGGLIGGGYPGRYYDFDGRNYLPEMDLRAN